MKRAIYLLTVFLLVAVILTACGPSAQSPVPTEAPIAPPAPTATQVQAGTVTTYPQPGNENANTNDNTNGNTNSNDNVNANDDTAYPSTDASTDDDYRFVLTADQSQARYIITEQLVGNDLPNDVIGVTKEVAGEVIVRSDGSIDSERSRIVVQVGSLTTDSSRRDGYVRNNTLQTSQYPEVIFVPTAISGLTNPLEADGEVSFQLTGLLTIKGTTKETIWEVKGTVSSGEAKGTAATNFQFADFNLVQPKVPVVLSIKDDIRLEIDIVLQRVKE
jgi:polyisoprenoid-binding protein YceI